MKALMSALDIRTILRKEEAMPSTILILVALILTIDRCFGSVEFAARTFAHSKSLEASLFMFISAFTLLGVLPCVVLILVFRERLRAYGLQAGDWRLGIKLNIILFPLIAVALLYPASQTEEMRSFYPFAPQASGSLREFFLLQTPRVLFFYTAWEFFFRGFMLFGLRRFVGDWLAICIQTVPQCLWHLGMPTGEILASIPGGVLFGLIAVRTNSIAWPLLLHCLIGVALDACIIVTS